MNQRLQTWLVHAGLLVTGAITVFPLVWMVSASLMPAKAAADALHVAAAAFADIDYLLTQNCRHIANAHTLPRIYAILADCGHGGLLICTPAEFLGELYDDKESNT